LRVSLPPHARAMRIGLFGGSFNPPHAGHLLVAQTALRRLQLDAVWWIVTPGNPLKSHTGLPSLAERMAACRVLIGADPRIIVTGFEADIGTSYTEQSLRYLVRRCPGVDFVWLMGADNLASFHRWQKWRSIASLVPMAVIDRPGATLRAVASPAGAGFCQGAPAGARSRAAGQPRSARLGIFTRPTDCAVFDAVAIRKNRRILIKEL
jgi:nicotinate-nucleotide adenylyltransferase